MTVKVLELMEKFTFKDLVNYVGMAVSLSVFYFASTTDMKDRITKMESKSEYFTREIDSIREEVKEIKTDIKQILREVKR